LEFSAGFSRRDPFLLLALKTHNPWASNSGMAKQSDSTFATDDSNRWHDFSRLTSLGGGPLPGDNFAGLFGRLKRRSIGLRKS
jgi:hypothetical protein